MKTREAIERLQERKKIAIELCPKDLRPDEVWPDEAEMSLNALKRDLPQDLYLEGDGYANGLPVYDTARCPWCDDAFEVEEIRSNGWKYCPYCGQRWKWPDAVQEEGE